jgi:CHAT domain-containing protein/tetratricopeptide (TPR) repeat protein
LQDLNQHLPMRELEQILERNRQSSPQLPAAEAHPHLAVCSECRENFESLTELEAQFAAPPAARTAPATSDCPPARVWLEIAGGVTSSDQTLTYIEHASACAHCGSLLHAAVGDFANLNRELTAEERREVSGLQSARPDWQLKLAERISGTPHPAPAPSWWRRWLSVPSLAAAGATVALVVGVAWWATVSRVSPRSADELLARAYTDQRTLELRIPGAAYAPLRVQKGPAESFTARSGPLLKAESLIVDQLARHPDDPDWLQASARANLLEGKYDAAVESLTRALELRPDSADILLDLGTAHFQRALAEDRQEDFGAAFESLSKVLAQQPDNTVALFNRALVAEHQFLYRRALEDWEHYLNLDPNSQWSEEARSHAEAVRTKLNEHGGKARRLLAPSELNAAVMDNEVDERVEEYLAEALRKWLPEAFPEPGAREADPSARRALFLLAELTAHSHEDRWLSDLLERSSAPQFARAVAALARAAAANDAGDYTASAERAARAEQLFRASGNSAGTLRAQFEQVFAAQLTRKSEECRTNASAALKQSGRYQYAWLQIQFGLEKGLCSGLRDDWGAYGQASRESMERAQASNYNSLYVRALTFLTDDELGYGNLSAGLRAAETALARYWSASMPTNRAYNVYSLLGSLSEFTANRPHLVVAVWDEATALVASDDDLLIRAWAYSAAGRAAAMVRHPEIAERQYAEAARLFSLAPKTDAIQNHILWNEILTAGAEARLGQFESGIARLTRIQDQIRLRSDKEPEGMFYATLGELELRSHHAIQAEQAFRPALESAERRLGSLNSEAQRISWQKEKAPAYLGMAEAKLIQGRDEEALQYFEWYLGAANRAGRRSTAHEETAPDPLWLASRLPLLSGRTVLAYAVLPDGLAIWCYDNRGITARWFPQSNQNLQELASRFRDLASDPNSEMNALRRDAQSLYRVLVEPVESSLEPGRTLVIEAEGWPARVPFEALLDSKGQYLIERAPIVHSLGQDFDASLHEDARISPDLHALILASSASSEREGLAPLPDVVDEADAIALRFRSPVVLKASGSTLATVEQELQDANVFHFSGHSLASQNGAALLLDTTGPAPGAPVLLTADKLRQMDLRRLELAVLSTCNDKAESDSSRGFNSIAATLQRAGVPHVIASRWAVDSAQTRKFIEAFYQNALSGQPASEAVRQAARGMLVNGLTSHPYYWAAFSAYGRP